MRIHKNGKFESSLKNKIGCNGKLKTTDNKITKVIKSKALQNWKISVMALSKQLRKLTIIT
jgi:hypothetical protein